MLTKFCHIHKTLLLFDDYKIKTARKPMKMYLGTSGKPGASEKVKDEREIYKRRVKRK